MKRIITTVSLMILLNQLTAQVYKTSDPLAHTFSIVARDEKTGQMAVAVQSHWFSVGTVVAWGEAGVGVIATQSFVNKSFGLRGLQLLKEGKSPQEAMDELLRTDSGREVRQVAILDTLGRVATHTGKNCIYAAGQINGANFSVQANMMLNDKVWPAMAAAWKKYDSLELPERVMEVMKAAQAAGGDIRGKQSAALLIFAPRRTDAPWDDKLLDLRVDDNKEPIKELERLLRVHRAYEHMNKGDLYVEKGDMANAMKEYNASMKMFPENLEMKYWTAITLATNKQVSKASKMLQEIYAKDPNWRELSKRLRKVGLLPVTDAELKELTK